MKLDKYLLLILIIAAFRTADVSAQNIGQETAFDRQLNTNDDQPLREFVESKENIDIKEKASNLEISGDVRFEWRSIHEKGVVYFKDEEKKSSKHESSEGYGSGYDLSLSEKSSDHNSKKPEKPKLKKEYRAIRGGWHVGADGVPISTNDFDVEFNLKLKYNFKNAWAAAHLQFDNPAGIRGRNKCHDNDFAVFNREGDEVEEKLPRDMRRAMKGSGEGMFITLKRAYIGYNVIADGKHRFDIEVGRRKLDDVFESEIEFSSRFDGILLKYASSIDEFSDWYIDGGAFVIDERVNHFGWVTEVGLIDLMDIGLDLRYSIIDWRKHGKNRCFEFNPLGTRFLNSQVSFSYTIHPKFGCDSEIPIEFYGGFLVNHAAKKNQFTRNRKKNLGWYGGIYVGNVHKQGDWSMDLEYIAVQAQAVSEYDVSSVGRGNVLDENLTDIIDKKDEHSKSERDSYHSSSSSEGPWGIFPRRGNTNFIGYRFEFLYAITDNLTIDMIYEFSNEEDRRIGGRHHYNDFELEAIYAF